MALKDFRVKNGLSTPKLTVDGTSELGEVANVSITGGVSGQSIITDGSGVLSFGNPVSEDSIAPMPTLIASGVTETVPTNFQGLFGYPIEVDGTLEIDGVLIDVNSDSLRVGGSNNQVQFNNGSDETLGASANFTFDRATSNLDVTGNITVSTGKFFGDGGGLSALAGANVTGTVSTATTAGTVTTAAQPNITSVGTLSSLTATGNITGGNLITSGSITLNQLSLNSDLTTTPPLQLTAGSLQDGVGALRIDAVEPDIYLNDTNTSGHSTVTFATGNVAAAAIGKNNNEDFYITVNTGSGWLDSTFIADHLTGNISLGYNLAVTGITQTGSYSNTALPTSVAGGIIYITNGNDKPAYGDGTNWYYFDNTQVT